MKEYGRIGQKRWEGVFNEEFLPELSGIRGVKTYREMLDNDDTIGAIIHGLTPSQRFYHFSHTVGAFMKLSTSAGWEKQKIEKHQANIQMD